ncbi:hypothetical protein FXV77_21810 [Sphingobacterium phlebotomi]|uniref:DinB-like domain-containing protein n=1 Tax=Sphingobacterium phlebotomi TaxID=2605433 RepID=A0A5D4GR36_9SPHI|nr:hypothetical protein FXV77_21810 [Sphingobacterium phlebotomi]
MQRNLTVQHLKTHDKSIRHFLFQIFFPSLVPYNLWAELPDANQLPTTSSIDLLSGLHRRWTALLKSLSAEDLKRQFIHPETNERTSLETNIGIYAWHGNHHLAHIVNAKKSDDATE